MLARSEVIQSLVELRSHINFSSLPRQVLRAAIEQNPWYTPYFIQERLGSIALWLEADILQNWLKDVPIAPVQPLDIGIIAAGNIPLVGFHDLISTRLAGHKVWMRLSRKDTVLMDWIIRSWLHIEPRLAAEIHLTEKIDSHQVDLLIGSGSDNTARHLRSQYPTLPKILRKHRYSLAVLDSKITDRDIYGLKRDILLYNGLGCRNVNNLLISKAIDTEKLLYMLGKEIPNWVNPHYIEKVTIQRAKYLTLNIPFTDVKWALWVKQKEVSPTEMGIINVVEWDTREEVDQLIKTKKAQIQCVVNKGTDFGMSQYPSVEIFEDNINLLKILTSKMKYSDL